MTDSDGQIRAKIDCMLGELIRAHDDMLSGRIAHRAYSGIMKEIGSDLTRLAVHGYIPGMPATPRSKEFSEDFSEEKENFIAP